MIVSAVELMARSVRLPRFYVFLSGLALLAGLAASFADAAFASPWLRIGVGWLVFILPGGYLFVLAPAREDWDLIDFIGYGFVYSIMLITLLGLLTRTLAWSIDTVELIWQALSLLGFASVYYKFRRGGKLNLVVSKAHIALFAVIFAQVLLFTHSSALLASKSGDQFLHHAEVNGFLRDEPLGWSEPYFETGNPVAERMYLTYWILAQALVVEISGAPILLARYLLNPFVVILGVAGMYIFARNLGQDRRASLVAVILGLLGLSLVAEIGKLPGNEFIVHGKMDKNLAAFVLAPLAISSAWLYWRRRGWRAFWAFVLSFLACVCVHGLIGGITAAIIGIWCLILFVSERGGRKDAIRIGLLVLLMFSPIILMRISTSHPDISNGENIQLNLELPVRKAGLLTYITIALVLMSAAARRLDSKSKLMLAFALVIGFGLLPHGVWVYRHVVGHSSRVYWLMPYGYMLFFVIDTARERFARLRDIPGWLLLLALPATAYFLQFHSRADFSQDLGDVTGEVAEMLAIAEYIDANHDRRVWIAGSPEEEVRSQAIAAHWKVASLSHFSADRMSYDSNMSIEQAVMQRNDNFLLYKSDVTVEQKLEILDQYGIDYLLYPKPYSFMIHQLYLADPERFVLVYSGETLRLVKAS